jgi:hypothetical protein
LIGGCNDGPTSVTVPAVAGRAAGLNFFGIGDKTEVRIFAIKYIDIQNFFKCERMQIFLFI